MADTTFVELITPRTRLVRMRDDHAEAFASYRDNKEVARYQSWTTFSVEDARAFITKMERQHPNTPGEWFQFAIEDTDGELVGDCAMGVDGDDPRQTQIGFTIAPRFWRQGFAREAVSALVEYAFTKCSKHRISATADTLNAASVGLLDKLGFRREAHFRENIWFKGRWGDEYVYALLKHEWAHQTQPFRGDERLVPHMPDQ